MRFAIVPDRTSITASVPRRSAAIASNRKTVGSSPYVSSPRGASAIAWRIRSVGNVGVSLRRLIAVGAVTSGSCLVKIGKLGPSIPRTGLLVVCTAGLGRRSRLENVGDALRHVGEGRSEGGGTGRLREADDRSCEDIGEDRREQLALQHAAGRDDLGGPQATPRSGPTQRAPLEQHA